MIGLHEKEDFQVVSSGGSDSSIIKGSLAGYRFIRYVPFILTSLIIILCVFFLSEYSFSELIDYTPENYFAAFFVLMGFYGLKSLSVVFPLTALFLAVGAVYPFWLACIVNLIGLVICYTIPYMVGRFSGAGFVNDIIEKYPKLQKVVGYSRNNNLFAAYVTRAIVFLPGDAVSMLHGALRMPFRPYLIGSLIGTIPQMMVQTYLAANIKDLDYKMILVLILLTVLTMLLSFPLNKCVSTQWLEADEDVFYYFDYFDEWDDGSI